MNPNENALILRPKQALFDVTDKSLYSFNEREGLSKFREAATVVALDNFFSLADSDAAKFVIYLGEKVPHIQNLFDALMGKKELVAKLSDKAKKKLASGEWHWVTTKDGSDLLTTLKDEAGHFAEQIKIGEKTIRPDMMNALISLTQQNNLDALTDKIVELTDTVERIAAGQYNDRISMFYEARQTYIEAMAMSEPEDRRIALLNAAHSANKAISSLQQTVKYDLTTLLSAKGKLGDRTKLIAKCFSILNDSVQISVNSYAALGENRALLAAVTSYQCFVEQTLLAIPEKASDKKYSGCTLAEIMHSCAELDGTDWIQLPHEIVGACETLIQTERETIAVIAEAFEPKELGGQEDEV